jgi:hypothetical protein
MYANAYAQAFSGNINLTSDSIKLALLTSGYTPNLTSHVHWSDVSASEASGTGYTAGGQALTSKSLTVTAANSFGTTWAATTAFVQGQIVRPVSGNGFIYMVVVGGTTSGSTPTFPTALGASVVDGTVTWVNVGDNLLAFTSASVNWTSSTVAGNFAVIYDSQTGTPSTEPLIALIQFGATISSTVTTFTVTPNSLGWFLLPST